jgi:predicted dehydrogenase
MPDQGDGATRLGLIGAGLIGARHAQLIMDNPGLALAGIADPSSAARAIARQHGVVHYDDFRDLIALESLEGVIVAAPNQLHGPIGLACIERGLPLLVEKPIADTFEAGAALVAAAEKRGLPFMVGHHRRFHFMVEATHAMLKAGEIGEIVAVSAMWATRKPDSYFKAAPWRRAEGGGPVLINLIHDIDCLRHFAGEIEEVHAIASNARRGFDVEDTAVAVVRFASGALGTVTLSDCAPSPWGWEAGSNDNPDIAGTRQNCYRFLGTRGSLDFPNLVLWRQEDERSWDWSLPLQATEYPQRANVPLAAQLQHFRRVIRGEEPARVSGREGLATLAATLAVNESARLGRPVRPRGVD